MAPRPVVGLVGRQDSLEHLSVCLGRAESRHPCLAVVSGELGVGKTRLVTEFLRRRRPVGVVGACVPVAGEALPFAALAQGLRGLDARARPAVDAAPELARLLPSRTGDEDAPGALDQLRLFQAVLALLERLGRRGPVVWVVEDLHWADPATLDLVRFVASNLTRERAMVVLTYRLDDVTRTGAMHAWLTDLRRLPRVEDVPLRRLRRQDAARLVESMCPPGTDPDVLDSIVTRADGNPLFAQHLVWQSAGADGPLPSALGDLLGHRLSTLTAPARALVDAACVLARPVTSLVLAATCAGVEDEASTRGPGRDPPWRRGADVEDGLKDALDRHVLRMNDEGLVEFHHPAFREAAYADLLPTRRAQLHRAAAQALLRDTGGRPASPGELARHWHLAGDLDRALESALTAGYAAERIPAYADAAANFRRALELADRLGAGVDIDRLDVLRHAARTSQLLGDDAEAVRLLGEALGVVTGDGGRADLLAELGRVHLMEGRGVQAEAALREARDLLPPQQVSALVARVHAGLALLAATWSHLEEAEREGRLAMEAARAVGAGREEGRAHNALGLVAAARGDHEGAARHLRRALEVARASGDVDDVCLAYVNLSHVLGLADRDEEVVAVASQGVEVLTGLGLVRQTGALLMANLTEALIKLGRYAPARDVVGRALDLHPRGIIAAPALLRAAFLALLDGDLAGADRHCAQARAIVTGAQAPASWSREVAEVSAEVELWSGRPRVAFDIVLDGLRAVRGTDEEDAAAALLCLGLRALGDLTESHRTPADGVDRERMQHELRVLAGDDVPGAEESAGGDAAGDGEAPLLRAWRATAAAERSRTQDRPCPGSWALAGLRWARCRRPYEATYALWREAEARLREGVDEEAVATLRAAADRARDLRIAPLLDEVEHLARWYRVDLPPPIADPDEPGPEDGIEPYALTPREIEVLDGLVAGRSNAEIATRLGMSVKTASVHVSHILHKLDVPVRQDAARLAHRLGVGR